MGRPQKGRYRVRPANVKEDGTAGSYTISVAVDVAKHVPESMEFTCEMTDDGILFRPCPPDEPEPEAPLPAWLSDTPPRPKEPATAEPASADEPFDKGEYGEEPDLPLMIAKLPRNPKQHEIEAWHRFQVWAQRAKIGFIPAEDAKDNVQARTEGRARHSLKQVREQVERQGLLKPGRTNAYWAEITQDVDRSWDPHGSVSPAVVELVFYKLVLDGPMSQAEMWHDLDLQSATMSAACLILKDALLIEWTGEKDHQFGRPSNIWRVTKIGAECDDIEAYMRARAKHGS